MALDLFKRVETRKGLFAVEKITLIYNLLTSILILFLFQRMDHPWHMLLDRAMIAAMTFLLMYLYRLAPCKFSAFVRIVIQMSLLSYWYPDTFEFNRFFPNLDHVFATAEEFIFNGQPAIWFCHTFPHLIVSEAFLSRGLNSISLPSGLIMYLKVFSLLSVTISIIIRNYFPDRVISMDSFIA